ncbi:MAG: LysR family transcriptional regulator [Solobacterium sp.]|nr:LysR family transcriptional regulator [Solobacterium sp.]
MELRLLKYFISIAEEESFTKAAIQLNLTQPTLSRQMAAFEEELGVKLFVRGKRKVTLTDEGLLFKNRAVEILELADKAQKELRGSQENLKGTISIGAGETEGFNDLVPIIQRFHQKFPAVQFEITSGAADAMKEKLNQGLLDLALFIKPVHVDSFESLDLPTEDQLGILACRDAFDEIPQQIHKEDLKGKSIGIPARKEVRDKVITWLGKEQKNVQSYISHNLIGNAAKLLHGNDLYLVTSKGSVQAYDKQRYVWIAMEPSLTIKSVVSWKKSIAMSPAVTAFVNDLKNTYQEGK